MIVILEGKTFNSEFFREPLVLGGDGFLYVINSSESEGIKEYIQNEKGKINWTDLSNNKNIKLYLEKIDDKEEKLIVYKKGDFSKWKVSSGIGYPMVSGYPPIKGTYKIVKIIPLPSPPPPPPLAGLRLIANNLSLMGISFCCFLSRT